MKSNRFLPVKMVNESGDDVNTNNDNRSSSSVSRIWNILGSSIPRSEVVFLSQMLIVCIIVIASIYNLSVGEEKTSLWLSLLTSSCSYLIPPPQLKPL